MPKLKAVRLTAAIIGSMKPGSQLWDSGVTGLGVRSTSNGRNSFIVRYRVRDTKVQKYVTIGRFPTLTVQEARSLAIDQLKIVEKGGDPSTPLDEDDSARTLQALSDYYLGDYAKSSDLKPRTIKDAKAVLRPILLKLGKMRVSKITTAHIRKAHLDARTLTKTIIQKSAEGETTKELLTWQSPYQANRLLAVLSCMFNLAKDELKWRTDNPCKTINKYPEDQRWSHLSEKEVGRLLHACDKYENQNAANAIRLLLFTGGRLNEPLKATWDQFDLDKGIWVKPSSHTKQKRQHRLDLEGPALELLLAMRKLDPEGMFLFPGSPNRDGQILRPRADLKRPWAWIKKEAKLAGYRIHDLRRTTASFMIDDQVSLETIGKALGQTQASTTARYAQLSQSVQRRALGNAGKRMVAQLAEDQPADA